MTMQPAASQPTTTKSSMTPSMTLWGVTAIGIDSMVGAGIFALLGQVALAAVPSLDIARIEQEHSVGELTLLGSMGLTFFAFAGFGMMTNAASDVANPQKTIPRAIFLAIGFLIFGLGAE